LEVPMKTRTWAWLAMSMGSLVVACAANTGTEGATGQGGGNTGTATSGGTGGLTVGATTGSGTNGAGGFNVDGGNTVAAVSGVGGGCAGVSQTATNQLRPVDIIWAVDTSDSMVNELQAVEDNMNVFAGSILNQGIDVHVVLIAKPGKPDGGTIFNPDPGICIDPPLATGVCPGGSKPPNYQHVEVSVGSNNALNKFIDNYQTYKPTLRPNAVKYFAVVSDDDATDGPINSAQAFITAVDALDPGYFDVWKFFGVFCTGSCGVFLACAATGDVFNDLITLKGGIAGDLCGGNNNGFAPVFAALAQTVIDGKQLDCEWAIPPPPAGQTFDPNLVNVNYTPTGGAGMPIYHVNTAADCGAQGGWYYDNNANPTKVLVCPSTCSTIQADPNGKIDIVFGCDTIDVPF
jgi:hypothetical protein